MNLTDIEFIGDNDSIVGGVDEAGRGPLAGPVVASCVIFNRNSDIENINDSKKLSVKKREILYNIIKEKAISIGIGIVHERKIDKTNILSSTVLAMKRALIDTNRKCDIVLIDGNKVSLGHHNEKCIVKGDSKSLSIAAASIIAKVTRDNIMKEYAKIFPEYDFISNNGYGTKKHINAIECREPTIIHRISFAPMKDRYDSLYLIKYIKENPVKYLATLLVKENHSIKYINETIEDDNFILSSKSDSIYISFYNKIDFSDSSLDIIMNIANNQIAKEKKISVYNKIIVYVIFIKYINGNISVSKKNVKIIQV